MFSYFPCQENWLLIVAFEIVFLCNDACSLSGNSGLTVVLDLWNLEQCTAQWFQTIAAIYHVTGQLFFMLLPLYHIQWNVIS